MKAIIVDGTRLAKSGFRTEKLKAAVPELYKETSAMLPLPTFVIFAAPGQLYHEIKEFGSHPLRQLVATLDVVPLTGLLERQNRLMWEHNGECSCGRKTYLTGQCMKCLEEDLVEKMQAEKTSQEESAEHLQELAGSLQGCTAGELLHPGAPARNALMTPPTDSFPRV